MHITHPVHICTCAIGAIQQRFDGHRHSPHVHLVVFEKHPAPLHCLDRSTTHLLAEHQQPTAAAFYSSNTIAVGAYICHSHLLAARSKDVACSPKDAWQRRHWHALAEVA
jgi:hypothetical protein